MKIFNYVLIAMLAMIIIGCGAAKQPNAPIVVTDTKTVYIPVYCPTPKVTCEFSGGGTTTASKMLKCIIVQKDALSFCSKDSMEKYVNDLIEKAKARDAETEVKSFDQNTSK